MDYKDLVNCSAAPCALVSAEITEDSQRGAIRIACGNKAFCDIVGPGFYENMYCKDLAAADSNFEDLCVRSAVMGQRVHTYTHDEASGHWMDLTFFPLVPKNDGMGYCLLFADASDNPDPERMAAVSMDTASAALKASLALMGSDDLRESVRQILDDVLVRSEGFSVRLTLVDQEKREAVNYCEAFVKGFFMNPDMAEVVIPYETVASWQDMLYNRNVLTVENDSDFDRLASYNPEWVATLRAFGVSSFIMTPLRQGGSTFGYLQLSNFNVNRLVEVTELMELITFLLSSQISNHLLMERLERMSITDGLTSLLNRHAMLQRIESISSQCAGRPFGIVNIDLNGLKTVNDLDGHDAGDKVLLRASEVLRKIFRDEDLFRTGGDEFVAIVTDIDQGVFKRKVARLRADADKNDLVSFAIGAYWSDGSADIRTAFLHADELMYADKDEFYKNNPDLPRR